MIRSAFRSFGVLACLLAACAHLNAPSAPPPPPQAPDNSWGAWWPTTQWPKDARAPGPEIVLAASREWERVVYPSVQTPWGQASPSFSTLEVKPPFPARRCLRFDLVFSGPGTTDERAWEDHAEPEPGAIRAEVISRGKVVRVATNGEARIQGWAGSRGTSGDLIIEFDWLPDDLDDYWVRARIGDRAVWFLLPYGFGGDPKKPIHAVAGRSGPPALPEGRGERDEIVLWSHVEIDLGWLDASGKVATDMPEELHDIWKWTGDKMNVSVRLSNPFDAACRVTLYRENGRWSLTTPRTTAAVGIPGKRVLFSMLDSLQRHSDLLRRSDTFSFYHRSDETRTWGLLRVTVEEAAFDRAIPGSLFLYTHGAPR